MWVLAWLLVAAIANAVHADAAPIPGLPVPSPSDILSTADITDCLARLANATAALSASPSFPGVYSAITVAPEMIEANTALFQSVITRSYCTKVVDLISDLATHVEGQDSTPFESGRPNRRRDAQRRRLAGNVTLEIDFDPDNSKFPGRDKGYQRFSVGKGLASVFHLVHTLLTSSLLIMC